MVAKVNSGHNFVEKLNSGNKRQLRVLRFTMIPACKDFLNLSVAV